MRHSDSENLVWVLLEEMYHQNQSLRPNIILFQIQLVGALADRQLFNDLHQHFCVDLVVQQVHLADVARDHKELAKLLEGVLQELAPAHRELGNGGHDLDAVECEFHLRVPELRIHDRELVGRSHIHNFLVKTEQIAILVQFQLGRLQRR